MKKKVYSLLGDFYHDHDIIFDAVQKAVHMLDDMELIDFELKMLSDVLDKNPDVIIMNKENRINPQDETVHNWLTDELDEKIVNYVKNGGSFIAMHATMASYNEDSKFIKMLKGYFLNHPPEHCPVRYISNENIPFEDKNKFDFEVIDEHYFLSCDEDNTNVFMVSESKHGKNYGSWNHSYGKGKVICIIPTHCKEGLECSETIRLIYNALVWTQDTTIKKRLD